MIKILEIGLYLLRIHQQIQDLQYFVLQIKIIIQLKMSLFYLIKY